MIRCVLMWSTSGYQNLYVSFILNHEFGIIQRFCTHYWSQDQAGADRAPAECQRVSNRIIPPIELPESLPFQLLP
jgi:hypothetical protein